MIPPPFIVRLRSTSGRPFLQLLQDIILIVAIMVAEALVYHPTVAHYLRFVATTGQNHPLHSQELPQAVTDVVAYRLLPLLLADLLAPHSWP